MNLLGLTQEKLDEWVRSLQNKSTESSTRTFQIPASGGVPTSQKHSQSRFTELFGTPVLDETEQVIGRLMVFRDITEEKELEKMREDLTSMMVHDLRSPLASVLSGLEMMKELEINEDSDPLTVQAMQISERSCQNMLTLVNSLLDINQLEAGKMPLERAPAPLPPLARSVVSRLSPLAAERDLTVRTELSPDLPLVVIDNEKIGRVLNNLLDNALKFSPAGGTITIRAVHQQDELGNHLLCSVNDTGPGIPQEYHEKIFGRFAQVRGQAAPHGRRGSGLGLAFCKLAIEAHDGRIWVESAPGQGSTFYFTLPVADIEAWLGE
jgi:NtrC-family two-component system sensor histidine kinase KinB